ncbi:MAG: glycosyltransferase family 39 protein [Chloroflexota bacterium]
MNQPPRTSAPIRKMVSGAIGRLAGTQARLIWLALLAIILLALAVRVHDLDGQSIWSDEGLSIYRARQSIPNILSNTITLDGFESRDTNPPLYFLLLGIWRSAAGESVFALRYLSVLAAVLSVALFYHLGRRAFGRPAGVAAAFLLALSPFHVWMSQEIRNYTLLVLLNLLSVYGLFRYAGQQGKRGSWRWLVLWGVASVAGIYVHFFGALVFAFGALAVIWLWLARLRRQSRWRPSSRLVIVLLLAGSISLPILWTGFSRFRAERQVDFVFVPLQHLASHALSAYSAGLIQTFVQPLWRVFPAVLLALAGLYAGLIANRRRERRDLVWLILGYLLLPFLMLFLLSMISPIYNGPRHLLMGLPPFLLLVAAGLALPGTASAAAAPGERQKRPLWARRSSWRLLAALLGLWLVASQAQWLQTQFTSDALVKDDYRGLAAYLSQVAQKEDVIILHDTISRPMFDYYYDGQAKWTAIPAFWQQDPQAALAELQAAAAGARRVWFVTEPEPRTRFPRHFLSQWADENWPAFSSQRFPWLWLRIKLDGYEPDPIVAELPSEAAPLARQWGEELLLHGLEAPDSARAGSYWQPILYWSRHQADPQGYRLSLRLVDGSGQVWLQSDQPLWPTYPPDRWPEGSMIRHQPIIPLPAGLPPGSYVVRMRLIRESDLQPLPAGDEVEIQLLPSLTIAAATYPEDRQSLPAHTPVGATLGGEIELVGFSLNGDEFRPGHAASLDVLWRVHRTPDKDYIMRAQLLDAGGDVISESSGPPSRADIPTSHWMAGEYLAGQAQLVVPATAEAGAHTIRLALLEPETMKPLRRGFLPGSGYVTLGQLQVSPWPLETELPPIPTPLRADFGQPPLIELHGYALTQADGRAADSLKPGDHLALTLFWRSLSDSITPSQSVFVHLMDEQDQIVAQGDGLPVNGFRPTTSWRQGEVIVDTHQLAIPGDLAEGSYTLWIGFYDPETFQRLPATADGQPLADDRLLLDKVQVSP